MSMHKLLLTAAASGLLVACTTSPTGNVPSPQGPKLGQHASAAMVSAVDISIPPSGAGLPAGSGTVVQGTEVYAAKCQSCHGEKGIGKPADPLVGGIDSLTRGNAAIRTVGSYWPYATTLFDYVRRSMPTTSPQTLSNEDVYAVTAYVLHLNGIVGPDAVMNAATLPSVKMPNRNGFVDMSERK